ncbi:MAG: Xaa-Pro peptidase family protein [Desulfocapsaceae bacterium]|nr:Xaa-Pro peptidase family protein [Desulfocapsaceae bacterium]
MHNYAAGPPAGELAARIAKLQKDLQENEISGALIVQKTDLYYFSGTSQQGWLYIPAEGKPLLMVFKEYERAKVESALENVVSLVSPKKIPQMLEDYGYPLPATLGMELDVLPANLYFQFDTIFNDAKIVDISTSIRLIRAIKSPFELERLRTAAAKSDKVADKFTEILEVGKTEIALAGELESYARSLGHQGIVRMRLFGSELFYGHLISGPGAAVPSYLASPTGGEGVSEVVGQGSGFKKIERNEMVLVDYVFAEKGYISDHARIFVIGELSDELNRAHDAMLDIQEKIKTIAVPGTATGEIYQLMVDMAEEKGYAEFFMGVGERKIRFTGHGVGLELDEFPFVAKGQKLPLAEGMVLALEPKVIIPGKGVVGIENTHLVTAKGLEPLTLFPDQICKVS